TLQCSSLKTTTASVKTEMPPRKTEASPLKKAKTLALSRSSIEVKRAAALLTWRATIPLERAAAPLARVGCQAQLIPVPAQQEESQRKFPPPSQGFVGVWAGGASRGRYGLEMQRNGTWLRRNRCAWPRD